MDPKLRNVQKVKPPFPLNTFPKAVVLSIAKDFIVASYTKGVNSFEGEEWERSFARAIEAQWTPSNVGLDDVTLGACCWGAKTVKSTNPFTQKRVRLISGRNSPKYSLDVSDVTDLDPQELGNGVLSIWNARVASVRERFAHVRTAVLMKGPKLLSGCLFEVETLLQRPELFTWKWNKNNNLEGYDKDGVHRFTWQPHGSQFTIVEKVPDSRACFSIEPPKELEPMTVDTFLEMIGYDDSWIKIH